FQHSAIWSARPRISPWVSAAVPEGLPPPCCGAPEGVGRAVGARSCCCVVRWRSSVFSTDWLRSCGRATGGVWPVPACWLGSGGGGTGGGGRGSGGSGRGGAAACCCWGGGGVGGSGIGWVTRGAGVGSGLGAGAGAGGVG